MKPLRLKCKSDDINRPVFSKNFKGIKLNEKPVGEYRTDNLKQLFAPVSNCNKIFKLQFLTRKHGRYSAINLKRIKSSKRTKAFYETSYLFDKNCSQALNTSDYKFSSFPHLAGIFKDFISLLARPKSFLMSVTRLSFTKIVLPMSRRRLKSKTSNFWHFSTGLHRFKATALLNSYCVNQSQLQDLDFINPATPRKKMYCKQELPIKSLISKKFIDLKEQFNSSILNKEKPLAKSIKNEFPALNALDGLPAQICSELKLAFNIIKCKTGGTLYQKNIIEPSPWQFSSKPYLCRIKLMPFQFGFPTFCSKKFNLLTLQGCSEQVITDTDNSRLRIDHFYFTPKTRKFRSKYSLKDPKSWLFKGELLKRLPKTQQAYYGSSTPVNNSFYYPPTPAKYDFSVSFKQKTLQLEKVLNSTFRGNMAEILKNFENFSPHWFQPEDYSNSVLSEISKIKESKITGLLLTPINLVCKTNYDQEFRQPEIKSKIRYFKRNLKLKRLAEPVFRARDFKISLNFKPIFAFYNKFPSIRKKIKIKLEKYHTRFRQFFFPYHPESVDKIENKLKFFTIEETSQTQDFDPSEEFRTSNIIEFAPVGVEFKTKYAIKLDIRNTDIDFNNETQESTLKSDLQSFETLKESKLPELDFESKNKFAPAFKSKEKITQTLKFFIKTEMAKLSQRNISKFAKKLKIKLHKLQPRLDSRTRISTKFDMASIHWVILLSNFLKINQSKANYPLKPAIKHEFFKFKIPLNLSKNFNFFSKPDLKFEQKHSCETIRKSNLQYSFIKPENYAQNYKAPTLSKAVTQKAKFSFTKLPELNLVAIKDRLKLSRKETDRTIFKTDLPEANAIKKEKKKLKLFKMDDKIVRSCEFTKLKATNSASEKNIYRHPTTPDWYDIEMDNPSFYVDTNYSKNLENLFS